MSKHGELDELVYARDKNTCRACGKSVNSSWAQKAHIIGKRKVPIKWYGSKVIWSVHNLAASCSTECNNKLDLGDNKRLTDKAYEIITNENLNIFEKAEEMDRLIRSK